MLLALATCGCSVIPKENRFLEETRALLEAAHADADLAALAPAELAQADETFRRAEAAWATLDDVAEVDHLAYVARQRIAIAREVARKAVAEKDAAAARGK